MNHYKYDILKFAPLEMIVDVNPFSLLLLPTFAISLDFGWCVAVEFVLCYRIYVFTMTSWYENLAALLILCVGNPSVTGGFLPQNVSIAELLSAIT